ncbi:MAG: rhomboid family intramembrane serine protease [archaeon]
MAGGMKVNIGKGTLWIVTLTSVGFLLQVFFPVQTFDALALVPRLVSAEPWRLVTYMFVHGSLEHLLMNLFAIFFFGLILEKDIGMKLFLSLYFISGIAGGYMQAYLFPTLPSVGASTAAFGIMGMLAFLRPMMLVVFVAVPLPLIIVVIGWAVSSYLLMNINDGIGRGAHLFGLLVGIAFGLAWRLTHKRMPESGGEEPEE